MKKKIIKEQTAHKKISRKNAIKKVGLTALTASTLFFLETKTAAAGSDTPSDPGW